MMTDDHPITIARHARSIDVQVGEETLITLRSWSFVQEKYRVRASS